MTTQIHFPVLLHVDITENEHTYLVEADVAQFRVENVKVYAWQDSLVIEMQSGRAPGQSYYLGELEPETFRRIIPLGFNVNDEDIQTHHGNGKLQVAILKQRLTDKADASRTEPA